MPRVFGRVPDVCLPHSSVVRMNSLFRADIKEAFSFAADEVRRLKRDLFLLFFVVLLLLVWVVSSFGSECVTNGTPGLVTVTINGTVTSLNGWSTYGQKIYRRVDGGWSGEFSSAGDLWWNSRETNTRGNGSTWSTSFQVQANGVNVELWIFGGTSYAGNWNYAGKQVWIFPSDATKQINYVIDGVDLWINASGPCTVSGGGAGNVANPCVPTCSFSGRTNEVQVSMPFYIVGGKPVLYGAKRDNALLTSDGISQTTDGELLGVWRWQECVGGQIVEKTNSFSGVVGWYIVQEQCPDGLWQKRRKCTGFQVSSEGVLKWLLTTQEVNSVTCGQVAAEAAGLVWSNQTASEQAAWTNAVPSQSASGVGTNSLGIGEVGGLGLLNSTNSTGKTSSSQSVGIDSGSVSNLSSGISGAISDALSNLTISVDGAFSNALATVFGDVGDTNLTGSVALGSVSGQVVQVAGIYSNAVGQVGSATGSISAMGSSPAADWSASVTRSTSISIPFHVTGLGQLNTLTYSMSSSAVSVAAWVRAALTGFLSWFGWVATLKLVRQGVAG